MASPIGSQNSRVANGSHIKVYGCSRHHMRGTAVCPITLRQAMPEVEASLAQRMKEKWFNDEFVDGIIADMRQLLDAEVKATALDEGAIEAELARLRGEQRNLATAVATGGDAIPELLNELRSRNERIRTLEIDLASARRTPAMVEDMLAKAEARARQRVQDLRKALETPADTREVFESVFLPEGLKFEEGLSSDGTRRVWAISMTAHPVRSIWKSDPTGT